MPIKQKTIWKGNLEISTDLYEQHPLLVFPEPEGDVFVLVLKKASINLWFSFLSHRNNRYLYCLPLKSRILCFFNNLLKHFPITGLFRANSFYISIFFQECKIIFHCCFTNSQYLMQFACGNIRIISHFCYNSLSS